MSQEEKELTLRQARELFDESTKVIREGRGIHGHNVVNTAWDLRSSAQRTIEACGKN